MDGRQKSVENGGSMNLAIGALLPSRAMRRWHENNIALDGNGFAL
jgi:hypothetical protein